MRKETPSIKEVERLVGQYSALIYRHCVVLLGNPEDARDAVQETFLRYMQKSPRFTDENHEKAWLLTVAGNLCRNQLRQRRAHPHAPLDSLPETAAPPAEDTPLLDRLTTLPDNLKIVLLLHYVEGYKVREIARRLHLTQSTVKMRLQKGRKLLKDYIKEEI